MRALFLFLIISFLGQAQEISKKNVRQAKHYTANAITLFNEGQSVNAYMMLSQAYNLDSSNTETLFWLASSEFELRAYRDAKTHIEKAIAYMGAKVSPDQHFLAAQINVALGYYHEALDQLSAAKKLLKNEKDYKTLGLETIQQQCEFALRLEGGDTVVSLRRTLLGINLNTKYDEYGPVLHPINGHLYYTSRNPDTKGANLNPDDQRYFEDIYEAQPDPNNAGNWEKLFEHYELMNTQGFDALSYISTDGLVALGTVNTTASVEQNTESSDIFVLSTEKPGSWDDKQIIKNIPGLNMSFFEGSATQTDTIWLENGDFFQEIYFVSDRQAEKYATEIFVVKNNNGIWEETAKALPQGINTEGRETTPYVSPDGQWLIFASDTHPGMGGYDLFYCHRDADNWSAPQNLGVQINSSLDDTHFQFYPKLKKIVWASVSELDGVFSYNLFEAPLTTLPAVFFTPKSE
ncbi:MAG: hypothetical protein ACKOWW_05595 [Flavobacteriales bacterium]